MKVIDNISINGLEKLKETYNYVFIGILAALAGAITIYPLANIISVGWIFFGLVIAEFAALIWFMIVKNFISYISFTALTGITLIPILSNLIGVGMGSVIIQSLIATTIITAGLTYYAGTTKNNHLSMGPILFWILLAVVVMSIINIFVGSSTLALIISIIAVLLFSAFIIYDTQQVLRTDITPLQAAMNLYLDILNIFVHLLQIFTSGNND